MSDSDTSSPVVPRDEDEQLLRHANRALEDPELPAADQLTAHAQAGWVLGLRLAEQDGPNPAELDEALSHLYTAAILGVDDTVIDDSDLLWLFGDLLLKQPDLTPEDVEDAITVYQMVLDEGLTVAPDTGTDTASTLDTDQSIEDGRKADHEADERERRIDVLVDIAVARRTAVRLGQQALPPNDELVPALPRVREDLAHAWNTVFLTLTPEDERIVPVATELALSHAERMVAAAASGVTTEDTATLIRLVHLQPATPLLEEEPDRASAIIFIIAQALLLGVEQSGDEEPLRVAVGLLDAGRARPGLPPDMDLPLKALLASALVNASDIGPLAARADEARALLLDVQQQIPADDPLVPQLRTGLARLEARSVAQTGYTFSTPIPTAALRRLAFSLGSENERNPVALVSISAMLDARFQRRMDRRDARAALEITTRTLETIRGTPAQRGTLLANRGMQLMRMNSFAPDPGVLDEALTAIRQALDLLGPLHPARPQLLAFKGVALVSKASSTTDPLQRQKLTEEASEDLRSVLAHQAPDRNALATATVLLALIEGDVADGRSATLRAQRDEAADAGQPTELIDLLLASSLLAHRSAGRADPQAIDRCLADLATAQERIRENHPVWGMRAMMQARLLRLRDDVAWAQETIQELERPPDINEDMLRNWMQSGGPDLTRTPELLARHTLAQIRDRPHRRRARELGLQALAGHTARVLLQASTADALDTANTGAQWAHEVSAWCLADGADTQAVQALESGRALTLLAAGVSPAVPRKLDVVGAHDLAEEWRHAAADAAMGEEQSIPDDVRHRALDRLQAAGAVQGLLAPPEPANIAAALRRLRYEALIYLIPRRMVSATPGDPNGQPSTRGGALMVGDDGNVRWQELPDLRVGDGGTIDRYLDRYLAALPPDSSPADKRAWRSSLTQTCRWAWDVAMGPLDATLAALHPVRPPRIVLVPVDTLGVVPWHAACSADNPALARRALDTAVLSYAASAALLCRTAARGPSGAHARSGSGIRQLLVGNPGGDLPFAAAEVRVLKEVLYPEATVWGEPTESTDGPAPVKRVRTQLAEGHLDLFHYAGHARVDARQMGASSLMMGEQSLRAETICRLRLDSDPGFLACLAACTTHATTAAFNEAFTLSTAFLTGGASTVIGSLWRIPDDGTAILMFMVHHELARGARPVEALHRAQWWMANPRRRLPDSMPHEIRTVADTLDLSQPWQWAGMSHQGW
jgi:hypothetical protein